MKINNSTPHRRRLRLMAWRRRLPLKGGVIGLHERLGAVSGLIRKPWEHGVSRKGILPACASWGLTCLAGRQGYALAGLLVLSGLLSSCATMQRGTMPSAPVAAGVPGQPVVEGAAAAPSSDPALAEGAGAVAAAEDVLPEDPGINREGRIIQLGRFVEERPAALLPADDAVELNYEQEDLRRVFEELGDALQLNMIIDPTIDDRVSLRTSTDNPLRFEDIWPLMRLLASNAGVTIEQAGNVWQFMKSQANVPVEIVMPGWLNDATSSTVLQVTPLTYISVTAAEAILTPMLQPAGSVMRLGQGNVLGISGSASQLARVNALLEVIDNDPFQNQGIQLYELLNSQAAEVAQELTNVLTLIEGQQPSYQVLALDRINAVLVLAPAARGFDEVNRWIRILDAESQDQVEQLFFYKVKNLSAISLAETLTNVFEQDDDRLPAAASEEEGAAETAEGEGETQASAEESAPEGVVSANLAVTIVADEDTNSLLVRSTPRDYRQLLTTINNLDAAPLQVLINAVIGQVTLTDANQFGVDWTRVSSNAAGAATRLTTRFLPGGLITADGNATQGSGLIISPTLMDGATVIDATLRALAQDNDVRLLARPTLLATNNQQGEIKVGQAVPIDQGASTSATGITVANIGYRDVGIVLTVTPQINEDGFINLEIFQSLSSIEEGSSGVANNPIFTNQEITTTAVVADQSTIALGGLIQEDGSEQNQGIPGLQRIPVLGGLFSYQQNRVVRRELFVILRPQIISGDEGNEVFLQEFRDTFEHVGALLEEAGL